ILTLPPFFYALYLSFVNIDLSLPGRAIHFVGLANYIDVFASGPGQTALIVNLIITFGATVLSVLVGFLVAYVIYEYAGRLDGIITTLVLTPMTVSPVAMALVFSLILNPLFGPLPQVVASFGGPLLAVTSHGWSAVVTVIF